MPKLTVVRTDLMPTCTLGLMDIDGHFECHTLEDTDRKLESNPTGKIYGETAIPRGKYVVVLDFSHRFKQTLPHVLGVPLFDGIRIHAGNTEADTHGCILVGTYRTKAKTIAGSRDAMVALMIKLQHAVDSGQKIELEIL